MAEEYVDNISVHVWLKNAVKFVVFACDIPIVI